MSSRIHIGREGTQGHEVEIGMLNPIRDPGAFGVVLNPDEEVYPFKSNSDIVPGDRFMPHKHVKVVQRIQELPFPDAAPGFEKGVIVTTLAFKAGTLLLVADRATSERAGAGGCFQVTELSDKGTGLDLRKYIDQGKHYRNHEELVDDLAEALGVSDFDADIEEVSD